MRLFLSIALRHLLSRKRQSIVSLLGIVIGTAFFLAIAALMQGSQKDFIRRLIDSMPHVTVSDTYRNPSLQPLNTLYPNSAVEIRGVRPQTETRGIRNWRQALEAARSIPGVRASATLTGQGILTFAGRDVSIVLNGMVPEEIAGITTIDDDMVEGTVEDLSANRSGIILGAELMRRMALDTGDNVTIAASTGQVRVFKIVGMFRTGRADYDETQAFTDIKRVQAITNRADRVDHLIIKIDDPQRARDVAEVLEKQSGYKAVSWQEANENILNTLVIRNIIMYSVVSAVLVVAGFGIYNIISTIITEKQRDIAILKSIGFRKRDIQSIFVMQGVVLGLAGIIAGLPFGAALMYALMQIRFQPPQMEEIRMPVDWSPLLFGIAAAFAMLAAILAAWLPARKGALLTPVDVLRGGGH